MTLRSSTIVLMMLFSSLTNAVVVPDPRVNIVKLKEAFSIFDPLAAGGKIDHSDFEKSKLVESKTWDSGVNSYVWDLSGAALLKREEGHEEKRATINIEGAQCSTQCGYSGSRPDLSHCAVVYQTLYRRAVQFTIQPRTIQYWTYETCSAYFVNLTTDTVAYDYWDFGGTADWLNGYCLRDNGAAIGICAYAPWWSTGYGVYTSINHKDYFQ